MVDTGTRFGDTAGLPRIRRTPQREVRRLVANYARRLGDVFENQLREDVRRAAPPVPRRPASLAAAYEQAAAIARAEGGTSVARIQERLLLPFERARRVIDRLENTGIIGPAVTRQVHPLLPPVPPARRRTVRGAKEASPAGLGGPAATTAEVENSTPRTGGATGAAERAETSIPSGLVADIAPDAEREPSPDAEREPSPDAEPPLPLPVSLVPNLDTSPEEQLAALLDHLDAYDQQQVHGVRAKFGLEVAVQLARTLAGC